MDQNYFSEEISLSQPDFVQNFHRMKPKLFGVTFVVKEETEMRLEIKPNKML